MNKVELVRRYDLENIRYARFRHKHEPNLPKPTMIGNDGFYVVSDGWFSFDFNSWTAAVRFATRWGSFLKDWVRKELQADSWGYL